MNVYMLVYIMFLIKTPPVFLANCALREHFAQLANTVSW